MSMQVELRGPELADHLARSLNDLEFELLVRRRIELKFAPLMERYPDLAESYNRCKFVYQWDDRCTWEVALGSSYRDQTETCGEVLSVCVRNVESQWVNKQDNKLSLLLPAPEGFSE